MKLLLTSGGIENKTIVAALRELIGKEFSDARAVFIPTAAHAEEGDKWWLIHDLVKCKEIGFREVDIVDLAAVPKEVWYPRLMKCDAIIVGGGNVSYLMGHMRSSGFASVLPDLLKTRVYVGISAGSMVTAQNFREKEMQRLYEEPFYDSSSEGLGLVDFLVVPHMNSPHFPRAAEFINEVAKEIKTPLYAIDDQTAIKIIDQNVEVISEGAWKKYN